MTSLIEINNIEEYEKYKNNLKLFTILKKDNDDYKNISSDILNLAKKYENVLFVVINSDKLKDYQLCKTLSSTPTFTISSNGCELSRYSGTDLNEIDSILLEINEHKPIR